MPRDSSSSRSDETRIAMQDQMQNNKANPPPHHAGAHCDFASDAVQPPAPARCTDPIAEGLEPHELPAGTNDMALTSMSSQKARETVSKLLQGKDKEWTAVEQKPGPKTLLSLPIDVLQEIVKEITHTNDLASLALTHSALHALAIPQIYSRFDIVWPDSNTQSEPRAGVDALTYGLATLVMAEDVFKGNMHGGKAPQMEETCCVHCGHCSARPASLEPSSSNVISPSKKRRRGNYYAEFTKKFSLGNGPSDWVQEYMITKEGGKMLGTLVALAVARMRRLETFTWDMPTGILQDVWDALASLGEHPDQRACRLEKVWVRWHNSSKLEGNYEAPTIPPRNAFSFWEPYSAGIPGAIPDRYLNKRNRVERPIFSALPPLKSLSVLDIDECAYLDEMAHLVKKSRYCLRELRVGIADHAVSCEWAYPWHGSGLSQHPKDKSMLGTSHWEKRAGGVIGVLVAHVFDVRNNLEVQERQSAQVYEADAQGNGEGVATPLSEPSGSVLPHSGCTVLCSSDSGHDIVKGVAPKFIEQFQVTDKESNAGRAKDPAQTKNPEHHSSPELTLIDEKLTLEVLELERVALAVSFLSDAFDWRTIRDLTILNCPGHAALWTCLRRKHGFGWGRLDEKKARSEGLFTNRCSEGPFSNKEIGARLQIRKIHTNTVTTQLINFIKDLEPNTLEVLFLQESPYHKSTVSTNSIMRAVRHHRGSLKKLLIDSTERYISRDDGPMMEWRKWMLNREMVHYITSGRMPKLRELSVAIDHTDWHHLLQRLPRIPHIRSLNLPFIAYDDGKCVESAAAREHALQIVDIITLRPDIELCYLGIAGKCFEILESRVGRGGWRNDDPAKAGRGGPPNANSDDDDENAEADADDEGDSAAEDEEDDEEEEEEDGVAADDLDDHDDDDDEEDDEDDDHESDDTEDDHDGASSRGARYDSDLDGDDDDLDDLDGAPGGGRRRLRFDVREILFYDDKVAIFKARHARL